MAKSWTSVPNANGNSTLMVDTADQNEDWKRPLAIALPVCLIGIPLITIISIVIITCYRSKFKKKGKAGATSRLNEEISETGESQVVTTANHTGDRQEVAAFANLNETVREAKSKTKHGNSSNGGSSAQNVREKIHWKSHHQPPASADNETPKDVTDDVINNHESNHVPDKEETKVTDESRWKSEKTDQQIGIKLPGNSDILRRRNENSLIAKQIDGRIITMRAKQQQQQQRQSAELNDLNVSGKQNSADNRKTFVVMYAMDSPDADKLSLSVNDVIFFMNEEKDGWMKGEKKGSGDIGWFPRSYVREGMSPLVKRYSMPLMENQELKEAMKTAATNRTTTDMTIKIDQQDNDADEDFDDDDDDDDYETGIEYRALYPYRALEEGDLNFDAGDMIVVVEKLENGWWRGYHGDEQGLFPGSYVQIINGEWMNGTIGESPTTDGELSFPSDDVSRSVIQLVPGGVGGEEAEDEDDSKKKKNPKIRKSLGGFFLSFPKKVASNRNTVSGFRAPLDKTKKSDKTMPWVKKKKQPAKVPMSRRSSLAPGPPPDGHLVASILKNSALFDLAQMVAETATAQHRRELSTTYEEIGTNLLGDNYLLSEDDWSSNNQDDSEGKLQPHVSNEAAEVRRRNYEADRKRFDVGVRPRTMPNDEYANLGSLDHLAKTEWLATSEGESSNDTGYDSLLTELKASSRLNQVSKKPVPPQKPNLAGSTPNIAELVNSSEYKTAVAKRKPRTQQKPRPLVKPKSTSTAKSESRDLNGLTQITKPKPLKEKPRYLPSGFPGVPGTVQLKSTTTKDLCRSLDSVFAAADAEEAEASENEEDLGIMRWLQKKLSVEDEMENSRPIAKRSSWNPVMNEKDIQQSSLEFSRGTSPRTNATGAESEDGTRIVLAFDRLSRPNLTDDSFV